MSELKRFDLEKFESCGASDAVMSAHPDGDWVKFEDVDGLLVPKASPLSDYHEDYGFVTWWKFPVNEPSYIGSPNCDDWPGYHTHWTPHPPIPAEPTL